MTNDVTDRVDSPSSSKKLILIRHASSEANEYMDQDGNRWGDPTFTDDSKYIDANLSVKGLKQADELHQSWSDVIPSHLFDHDNGNFHAKRGEALIVTSPLTRTIQTMTRGVLPNLSNRGMGFKVFAQPLATERVYTSSDTGRPKSVLKEEFPHVDFHTHFGDHGDDDEWWYTHCGEAPYKEWRPSGESQSYAVPGEPVDAFHKRMVQLYEWIRSREEQTIVLVCHWAIIRFFTGEELSNCGVKILDVEKMELKTDILSSNL